MRRIARSTSAFLFRISSADDGAAEYVDLVSQLLSQEVTTYEGRFYQAAGALMNPRPVQTPRPPLIIGGGGEKKTLRLTAEYADIWHSFSVLATRCADFGRDPADIEVSVLATTDNRDKMYDLGGLLAWRDQRNA